MNSVVNDFFNAKFAKASKKTPFQPRALAMESGHDDEYEISFLAAAFAACIGAGFLYFCGMMVSQLLVTARLREIEPKMLAAPGTITSLSIKSEIESSSAIPKVTYEYTVNGTQYTNDRVAAETYYLDSNAERIRFARLYAPGTSLTVHYDPERPERSMLIRGHKGSTRTGLLIFAALAGIAGVVSIVIPMSYWIRGRHRGRVRRMNREHPPETWRQAV